MRELVDCVVLPRPIRTIVAATTTIHISTVRAGRSELERELSAGTLDAAIDVGLPLPEDIERARFGQE
jgi:hypothetical protein